MKNSLHRLNHRLFIAGERLVLEIRQKKIYLNQSSQKRK